VQFTPCLPPLGIPMPSPGHLQGIPDRTPGSQCAPEGSPRLQNAHPTAKEMLAIWDQETYDSGPFFLEWEWFYGSTILSNFFFTLQDVPCNHVAMSSLYICFIVPNVGTTATRTVNIDILLLYTHDRIYIYNVNKIIIITTPIIILNIGT